MVVKEVVEKIIYDNDLLPVRESVDLANLDPKKFAWSKEKIALRDFIASLTFKEVLDIISLMGYGRECYQMQRKGTVNEFAKIRANCAATHRDSNEREHLANHLLQKKQLSSYLRCSLHLYDEKELRG